MKISITKGVNGFTLDFKSGHFTGTLDEISKDSLVELKESLDKLLSESSAGQLVWNPRSQRHERV